MKGLRQSVLELDTHVPADIYNDQLAQTNMIAGMKFCGERGKDLDAFLPPIYASGNADREGKFSFGVFPGSYLVYATAEAGKTHVEWYEIAHVTWRQTLHLVQPTCSYTYIE
jgi:hypothetical protein